MYVLVLLAAITVVVASTTESPFALSLGPHTITASRFNSSGAVELYKFPNTESFREYHAKVAQTYGTETEDDLNKDEVKAILTEAITPALDRLKRHLGEDPDITAFFLPSIFNWQVRHAAGEVLFPDGPSERAVFGGKFRQAAYEGYEFLQCKNLGREPEECTSAGPLNLVLVLEYEREYLHAWILEVDFEMGMCPMYHERFSRALGEKHRDPTDTQQYNQLLTSFVEDLPMGLEPPHHRREDVRAIIVLGDVSAAANDEQGRIARETVGYDTAQVLTDIKASEVVAHGAAVWARLTQTSPSTFLPSYAHRDVEHDEL